MKLVFYLPMIAYAIIAEPNIGTVPQKCVYYAYFRCGKVPLKFIRSPQEE